MYGRSLRGNREISGSAKASARGSIRRSSRPSPRGGTSGRSATSFGARAVTPTPRSRRRSFWRGVPVPVIAAVHGPCFGGGFQIALGADMRYVTPDARLSILEIKWGIVPDMGGIALMRELAGGEVIRELAFTGREFTGAEAVAYGLATAVHPDPLAAARSTAREIAGRSPDAVRALKRLLNLAAEADMVSILLAESKEQARLIGSLNQIEAIRAGVEKRPPRFADPE